MTSSSPSSKIQREQPRKLVEVKDVYRFINWALDHIFPSRKSRDEYLIRTYIREPILGIGCVELRTRERTPAGIYLDLFGGMFGPRQNIYQVAMMRRISVEQVQAAVAYLRRHPDYLQNHIQGRRDVKPHLLRLAVGL